MSKWLDLIEALYPNNRRHVVNWFAHRIQHSAIKTNHARARGAQVVDVGVRMLRRRR